MTVNDALNQENPLSPGDDSSSKEGSLVRLDYQNEKEMVNSSESNSADQIEPSTIDPRPIPVVITKTNHSTLEYEPIPRSERRGILARFVLIPEVRYPTAYPRKTKWMITSIVALCGAAAPMGSAIVMPALLPIAHDFHASTTTTNLSVALYMLSMSFFPLWWSSFSETLGRRTIYIISFAFFVLFGALAAVSTSIGMLVAMRMLSGGAAASVQAVGAGSISDIWEPKERGRAMGIFYLGPLCGPMFAPIVAGGLTEGLGWRSTQWFLVIFGGLVLVALIFFMPETLRRRNTVIQESIQETHADLQIAVVETGEAEGEKDLEAGTGITSRQALSRTTTRQSVKVQAKEWIAMLKRFFVDPLKIILLLRFPVVTITVLYASISFGSLYFLNISIEDTFARPPYNFSTTIIGLMYIPNSLGYVAASLLGGPWIDYIMKREAQRANRRDERGFLIYRPEDRMRENAWLAAICFPMALVWYGWTIQKGVYWIVPAIANFFFGIGTMLIFGMSTTMLTEFMSRKASTGIAVNNFIRNIVACAGGVVAAPVIHAIGNGWICTIIAIVALISGIVVISTMKRFGPRWGQEMEAKLSKL